MPKEQSILELARTLVREGCLRDTDAADRLVRLAKPGSAAVIDLDHDMWSVAFSTDQADPDKGCKTWGEVATHVFRRVESALSCESITDVILCTTIKSPPLKSRITAKRKQGHVFITKDENRKHILDSLPMGFYPDHTVQLRKKDVHYDDLFKMHYLVFLTTWIIHRVKIPVNSSLTMMGGALYMDVRSNQLISTCLNFETDESQIRLGFWQPVFLDRPLQVFHDGNQPSQRRISWTQTIPSYLNLTKTGQRMGWEMMATTDADLWTSFASVMLQQAQTKDHVCIVSANDRDQFNILLLRSEMYMLVEKSKRPAKQTTYYMHPISLGSYQGHPNMCTEYIDMTQVASCFSMMAQRWTKLEDGKVVIPSPGCMIFVLISEIRGGDYTQLYPQRIAFEDYYASLVRNHEELQGMLKYYPEEMDEQGFAPHMNTKMHIDINYPKFLKFVCLAQDAYRKRKDQKEKDNKIDEAKLRVQVANLIWVLYLEANCWKCNTLPLDCFEKVEQDGQKKSLYGWKKDLMETVPTQDDNVAIYTVYSSNPPARR